MSPAAIDATARLGLRRRDDRRRRRRHWAIAGLAGVAVVGLVWLVVFSQVLAVTEVVVRGTKVTTRAEALAAAQIVNGTPLVLSLIHI